MAWLGWVELSGGLLGILGSILLAVPAALDLINRRFWDRLDRLNSIKGATAADAEALRWLIIGDVLGGYRLHVWCTAGGGALLTAGFVLIAIAGGMRVSGTYAAP